MLTFFKELHAETQALITIFMLIPLTTFLCFEAHCILSYLLSALSECHPTK